MTCMLKIISKFIVIEVKKCDNYGDQPVLPLNMPKIGPYNPGRLNKFGVLAMKKSLIVVCAHLLILIIVIVSGCTIGLQQSNPTEDTLYLTPIPQSTLLAYSLQITPPISTKLQAVILARRQLMTTRLVFTGEPVVVSAEEMSLDEALQQIGETGGTSYIDKPGNSKIWLVTFEGEIQIIFDPLHTTTPNPPAHRCAYVIVDANNTEGTQVTSKNCPSSP